MDADEGLLAGGDELAFVALDRHDFELADGEGTAGPENRAGGLEVFAGRGSVICTRPGSTWVMLAPSS